VISGVGVLSSLLPQPETCSGFLGEIAARDIGITIAAIVKEPFTFISSTSSYNYQLVGTLEA
jgi:hypothetical protein